MPQLRVALDTSTLRRDPKLNSGPIEALARFAEEGYVQILIPEVIADEFTTLPSTKIESLTQLRATLKDLRRNTPDDLHTIISRFENVMVSEFEKIDASARTLFSSWVSRTRSLIVDTGFDHGNRVLKKYFGGAPPFRRSKSREDFPDAFILETLTDLASKENILVVSADKRLADALTEIAGVTVFDTVKDLIASDEFDELRGQAEVENAERIVAAFQTDKDLFDHALDDSVVNLLAGTFVSYRNPTYDERDNEEQIYIESVGPVLDWEVADSGEYLGEGVVAIDFSGTVEVEVDMSSGDEYYDEFGSRSSERNVAIEATLSLRVDRNAITVPYSDWTGAKLQHIATLDVDELHSIRLINT